jgi:hypothetical protein
MAMMKRKHVPPSRGAQLLRRYLDEHSLVAASTDVVASALRRTGRRIARASIWQYVLHRHRPSIGNAALIEDWTSGEVPMTSWLDPPESEEITSGR